LADEPRRTLAHGREPARHLGGVRSLRFKRDRRGGDVRRVDRDERGGVARFRQPKNAAHGPTVRSYWPCFKGASPPSREWGDTPGRHAPRATGTRHAAPLPPSVRV